MRKFTETPLSSAKGQDEVVSENREPTAPENYLDHADHPRVSSHGDFRDFEEESKIDIEKIAESRDSSGSISPCPGADDDEGDDRIVIGFEENDPSNPYNWSIPKKMYVIITGIVMVLNSTMGSALPSGTVETIEKDFNVRDSELLVLPVSIYLIGYILGPMVFAPLSESYGRKYVMIGMFKVSEICPFQSRKFLRNSLIS